MVVNASLARIKYNFEVKGKNVISWIKKKQVVNCVQCIKFNNKNIQMSKCKYFQLKW